MFNSYVSAQETSAEGEVKDEFKNLVSNKQLVYQLRKNYGIEGSVILSKTLWEILTSYSNQQQAKSVWQRAVNDVTDIVQGENLSIVDSQSNLGLILARYTNGMTAKKWQDGRRSTKLNRANINDFFRLSDDLTIYLQLNDIWHILLSDIAKQENIQWSEVFAMSLNFSEVHLAEEPTQVKSISLIQFDKELDKWQNSEDKQRSLSDFVRFIENSDATHKPYYYTVLKFELNKYYQHYLASALSWFSVAQHLYRLKSVMNQEQQLVSMAFIEENDTWFLSQEQALLNVNKKLPEWIESSFHSLKAHYRDDSELVIELKSRSAYRFIDSTFDKYISTPFRSKIYKELEVCLNISEEFSPFPQQPIDENQFKGCIADISNAAITEASNRELSGSLTRINNKQALVRALQSPPWQIINIMYANAADNNCLKEADHLVNPLEWALAAESLLWFTDRWPAYIQRFPHKQQINNVIAEGEKLVQDFTCISKSKRQILDSHFTQITQAWQTVKTDIKQLVTEFNQDNLKSGSDIDLLGNVDSNSNYRVEDVKITACDPQNSCGVHIDLESSRALYGMFPNHLLVADQLKLGTLKLCYDKIAWENRRAAATHLNNDSVANYFGNFSFSLKGFYNEDLVFERRLTDKNEYLYLFAENSVAVENISCPLSIVGNKISTELERGTFGLVPNRLTFLTASRADEGKLLSLNWSDGEEWRDKIISEDAEIIADNKLKETSQEIQQTYQQMAKNLQDIIYQTLLNRVSEPSKIQKQLSESFSNMQLSIELFKALNYLFSIDELMINDNLHGLFYGSEKITDIHSINDLYHNQINIKVLISDIDVNLNTNQQIWNDLDNNLSNSHIKNILYRLKSIGFYY